MTNNDEREVQYLARYHSIKLSDATIYRILKRNGLNRLPRGTPCAKDLTRPPAFYDKTYAFLVSCGIPGLT